MSGNSKSKSSWVSALSWPEIEQRIESGAGAVLPVGACAKEHGLHLPMNTDYLQAKWLADKLALKSNLLIWPVVSYGYYPAFTDFPGSVTLRETTFSSMIKDIVTSIFSTGVARLALLNTGISTIKPLDQIGTQYGGELKLINVYAGRLFRKVSSEIIDQSAGGHADETETSIMLAIDKKLVNMGQASGSLQACLQPGVLSRNNKQSSNYTPTGACGAPHLATLEKGSALLRAMLVDIDNQLNEFGFQAY